MKIFKQLLSKQNNDSKVKRKRKGSNLVVRVIKCGVNNEKKERGKLISNATGH